MNKQEAIEVCKLLKAIIEVGSVEKILGTFIKAMKEKSILKEDGNWYLHGSFNLGAVISGRLSSSNPNLTNLPSGSTYGALIKSCFKSNKEWVFGGADFNSLESVVNAIITNDPNKLRPLIEGIDSHCFNSFAYYVDKMPDIVNTKESINSIKTKYPKLRKSSKPITFAGQYGGSWVTYVKNCGIPKEEAQLIEKRQKDLYWVSEEWVADKMQEASKAGYVTLAFGLRLRTPILSNVLLGSRYTPREASAEARSAGNAVGGQSYSMLLNRAAIEFMEIVRNSRYKYDIKPVGLIHDNFLPMWRNTLGCTKFVNDNLIKCMQWQDLPELQHDTVKLSACLDVFPSWDKPIELKNNLTIQEINQTIEDSNAYK